LIKIGDSVTLLTGFHLCFVEEDMSSSSTSSSDAHSSESVRAFGLSAKYAQTLKTTWIQFTEWYAPKHAMFKKVLIKDRHTQEWTINETPWIRMMEAEDDDDHNALFQFVLERRQHYWDDQKSGLSYFTIVRSSIKKQMKSQHLHYSEDAEENLKGWYKCLRKADAKWKQDEGLDDHAKSPVPIAVYEEMCKELLRQGQIVWWCFMVLQWNLMARSLNIEEIHLNFISWSGDMMTCLFAHTKTLHGDRSKLKPVHLSTNQNKPWICPVVAVSLLLMRGFHGE